MAERRPAQLSGGQQQRVALARALVNRPAALLLDEPLGALDLKLRKEMQLELKDLQTRTGTTFVYVTHDQEEAMAVSDRIAVMNHGSVVQVGTAADLYHRPESEFVAQFVGRVNLIAGRLLTFEGDRARVALPHGEIVTCAASARVAPGDPVQIALRPEAIELSRDDGPRDATVLSSTFLGDKIEYVVRWNGETLQVARYNAGPAAAIPDGTSVALRFAADAAMLSPMEATP
jgi:ABC-type Fe3+/spermidine/putrescine transport system ATPase subunit